MLSNMESSQHSPTPEEAAADLVEAEASRTQLAGTLELPTFFYGSIGAAISTQIGTTAFGIADSRGWALWLLLGGLALFGLVAAIQLTRFRRLNGVWLGGLASRVVLGTANAASISYVAALGASVWAAFNQQWWLVAFCSAAGGAAYALSGRRWWRRYQGDPAPNSRGESAGWLAVISVLAVAGAVLLVLGR